MAGNGKRIAALDNSEQPCLLWTGAANSNGYGRIRRGGRLYLVHRYTWEQHHGPIPDGLVVMHKCDVRACYEITHLTLGTVADNNEDMTLKGRRRGLEVRDHCKRGHPFDEANTFTRRSGRGCRQCRRDASKRHRERSI